MLRGQDSVGRCLGIGAEEIAFGVAVVGIEGWARISIRVAGISQERWGIQCEWSKGTEGAF